MVEGELEKHDIDQNLKDDLIPIVIENRIKHTTKVTNETILEIPKDLADVPEFTKMFERDVALANA